MNNLTEKQDEILTILIEECAEVIQVATKIKRFGLMSAHPEKPEQTNFVLLSKEVGDLSTMIHLAMKYELACNHLMVQTAWEKFGKLEMYSTHLKNEEAT
jgi:hypothetical protein